VAEPLCTKDNPVCAKTRQEGIRNNLQCLHNHVTKMTIGARLKWFSIDRVIEELRLFTISASWV
jgi:hypothetical protein